MNNPNRRSARLMVAGIFAIAGLGLTGCNTEGPEEGTDVEDISEGDVAQTPSATEETDVITGYEGPYDEAFAGEVEAYVGEEVTVSAEVTGTLSDSTFVIAGDVGTTVDPLLIVEEQEIPPLDEGQVVQLTGTVEEGFDVVDAEESLGIELEDELYADYVGEPYIAATSGEILED